MLKGFDFCRVISDAVGDDKFVWVLLDMIQTGTSEL